MADPGDVSTVVEAGRTGLALGLPVGRDIPHLPLLPLTPSSRFIIHAKATWLCPSGEKDLGEIRDLPLNSSEVWARYLNLDFGFLICKNERIICPFPRPECYWEEYVQQVL